VPTRDSIVEFRFKFAGATSLSAEFDDRKYTGSHYGHICFVRVTPKGVTLADQKDGSMRNDIYAMTDPAQKAEKPGCWQDAASPIPCNDETACTQCPGKRRRHHAGSIDGKPVAFLKSSGIAHPPRVKSNSAAAGKTVLR